MINCDYVFKAIVDLILMGLFWSIQWVSTPVPTLKRQSDHTGLVMQY